jgi:hypothetical protein
MYIQPLHRYQQTSVNDLVNGKSYTFQKSDNHNTESQQQEKIYVDKRDYHHRSCSPTSTNISANLNFINKNNYNTHHNVINSEVVKNNHSTFIVSREYKKNISTLLQQFSKLNPSIKEVNFQLQTDSINSSIEILQKLNMEQTIQQFSQQLNDLTCTPDQAKHINQAIHYLKLASSQQQQPQHHPYQQQQQQQQIWIKDDNGQVLLEYIPVYDENKIDLNQISSFDANTNVLEQVLRESNITDDITVYSPSFVQQQQQQQQVATVIDNQIDSSNTDSASECEREVARKKEKSKKNENKRKQKIKSDEEPSKKRGRKIKNEEKASTKDKEIKTKKSNCKLNNNSYNSVLFQKFFNLKFVDVYQHWIQHQE